MRGQKAFKNFRKTTESRSQRKSKFRKVVYELIVFTVDMVKRQVMETSAEASCIHTPMTEIWRIQGSITLAQFMMTAKSPKMFSKGIPIILVTSSRAQSAISSALVLVQVPAPISNSNEWDSFRNKQKPTPPIFLQMPRQKIHRGRQEKDLSPGLLA